jgi:hypothetical protein
MATTEEITAKLEALKSQRASGVARVSYDGKTIEYRGDSEIVEAIRALERELSKLSGSEPIRQIRTFSSKGY